MKLGIPRNYYISNGARWVWGNGRREREKMEDWVGRTYGPMISPPLLKADVLNSQLSFSDEMCSGVLHGTSLWGFVLVGCQESIRVPKCFPPRHSPATWLGIPLLPFPCPLFMSSQPSPHHTPPPPFHPMMVQGSMAWPAAVASGPCGVSRVGFSERQGVWAARYWAVSVCMTSRSPGRGPWTGHIGAEQVCLRVGLSLCWSPLCRPGHPLRSA